MKLSPCERNEYKKEESREKGKKKMQCDMYERQGTHHFLRGLSIYFQRDFGKKEEKERTHLTWSVYSSPLKVRGSLDPILRKIICVMESLKKFIRLKY